MTVSSIYLKVFITICLIFSGSLRAQHNSVIDDFTAVVQGNNVFLAWQINHGSLCNGINIYRSTDSLNFNIIGDIQGVCGSSTQSVRYTFTDENPVSGIVSYYKIELGGINSSSLVSIRYLDLEKGEFLIQPNPISSNSKIYFDYTHGLKYTLEVFNSTGNIVFKVIEESEFFNLSKAYFSSGVYFFSIISSNNLKVAHGSFYVL